MLFNKCIDKLTNSTKKALQNAALQVYAFFGHLIFADIHIIHLSGAAFFCANL